MQPHEWSDHLLSLVGPVLAGTPLLQTDAAQEDAQDFLDSFADEAAHRRPIDRPLLAHMLGIDPGTPTHHDTRPDARLWWALHDASAIDTVVTPAPGPVIGALAFTTGSIETTTETELSALHALSHHARRDPTGRLTQRCLDAARWHIAELQPDNGTNHPWAVHVFLSLAEADPPAAATATLHAETLVHNALVASGRPDRFSACLLLDAARSLARA